jgi:hypothetical protein
MMKKLQLILFLTFVTNTIFDNYAQVTVAEKGRISFRLVYGNEKRQANDCELSSIAGLLSGSDVFPYQKIVIYSDWWTLMGQLVYNNGIKWELKEQFTFTYQQKLYTIDRSKLSKYPDLIKRLDAAGPINKWSMDLLFYAEDNEQKKYDIRFKISDNDIIAAWKNGVISYKTPGSPRTFKERVTLSKSGLLLDEVEIKEVWNKLVVLNYNDASAFLSNNSFKLENPYETWIEIANLYETYEKEGYKTLSETVTEEIKQPITAYDKDDFWATPYEKTELIPTKSNYEPYKWGFRDQYDQVVIPFKFDKQPQFKGSIAIAAIDRKSVVINKKGDVLYGPSDQDIIYIGEKLCVREQEEWKPITKDTGYDCDGCEESVLLYTYQILELENGKLVSKNKAFELQTREHRSNAIIVKPVYSSAEERMQAEREAEEYRAELKKERQQSKQESDRIYNSLKQQYMSNGYIFLEK